MREQRDNQKQIVLLRSFLELPWNQGGGKQTLWEEAGGRAGVTAHLPQEYVKRIGSDEKICDIRAVLDILNDFQYELRQERRSI